MGIRKFLDVKNVRSMVDIAKISGSLDKHMAKRCAYCDMDLGTGEDVTVITFVEHLADNHLEKVDEKDIIAYRKLIEKMTG